MKLAPAVPILLVLASGWVSLSCADIAAPTRSQVYEWRLITTSGPGTTDTLSFHWPRSRLPVRIWAEETLDLPGHVQNGIQQWKSAFLYGEFDAVRVPDSNAADVIVTSQVALKDGFFGARLATSAAPECEGGTDILLPPGSRQIQLPIRVFVTPRFDPASPGVAECLALTTTHELGHAIGIFAHSPVATDIMHSDPTVSGLSARDRATVERAYHLDPNLTATAR
jgi:hypothetical protein